MSSATLILDPYIIVNGKSYDSIRSGLLRTVDKKIADNIAKDRTNIQEVFNCAGEERYKVVSYVFNKDTEDIVINLFKNNGKMFAEEDKTCIEEEIDAGPDTWMEDGITILTGEELFTITKNPIHKDWNIELGFEFLDLLYTDVSSEEETDSDNA